MKVIKFLQEYQHTERRTWQPGDTPTVSNGLAASLIGQGIAVELGDGCGCPGQAADLLSAFKFAPPPEVEEEVEETPPPPVRSPKAAPKRKKKSLRKGGYQV